MHRLVLVEQGLEGLLGSLWLALWGLGVAETLLGEGRGVWVEAEKDLLVAEWVLLLDNGALADGGTLDWAEDGLNLRGVDQLGNVWLSNNVLWKKEVLLEGGGLGGGAVDLVEGGEGGGGPDDETAEVSTWGELEEVQGVDWGGLDTWDVAESGNELLSILVWVVDDERTTALLVAAVPQLTLTSTELAGSLDLLDIGTSTDGLQESDGSGGLGDSGAGEGSGGNDEWDLWDARDTVATGEEEGGVGRGSQGRNGSETPGNNMLELRMRTEYAVYAHFWPRLIFWCHFLQTLVGANMRPERHWLPKAA